METFKILDYAKMQILQLAHASPPPIPLKHRPHPPIRIGSKPKSASQVRPTGKRHPTSGQLTYRRGDALKQIRRHKLPHWNPNPELDFFSDSEIKKSLVILAAMGWPCRICIGSDIDHLAVSRVNCLSGSVHGAGVTENKTGSICAA